MDECFALGEGGTDHQGRPFVPIHYYCCAHCGQRQSENAHPNDPTARCAECRGKVVRVAGDRSPPQARRRRRRRVSRHFGATTKRVAIFAAGGLALLLMAGTLFIFVSRPSVRSQQTARQVVEQNTEPLVSPPSDTSDLKNPPRPEEKKADPEKKTPPAAKQENPAAKTEIAFKRRVKWSEKDWISTEFAEEASCGII